MEFGPGMDPVQLDRNIATNVRLYRELGDLSQGELAQRMSELGFGFTQATVWKIESGQRSVKVSEAMALARALELPMWGSLTADPDATRHRNQIHACSAHVGQAYDVIKQATVAYVKAQLDLWMAVHHAQEAGMADGMTTMWASWLELPAEQAVLEARVEYGQKDEIAEQTSQRVDAIMTTLREHGYDIPPPDADMVPSK